MVLRSRAVCFFFQAEDGIRDKLVTGVQTCALPVTNEAAIAASSLQALIRHQYQRRISTEPVPAPSASRKRQPCSTEERTNITAMASTISKPVAARDTSTCSRLLAPRRTNRSQTSFTR